MCVMRTNSKDNVPVTNMTGKRHPHFNPRRSAAFADPGRPGCRKHRYVVIAHICARGHRLVIFNPHLRHSNPGVAGSRERRDCKLRQAGRIQWGENGPILAAFQREPVPVKASVGKPHPDLSFPSASEPCFVLNNGMSAMLVPAVL